jgi:hypothetical protein
MADEKKKHDDCPFSGVVQTTSGTTRGELADIPKRVGIVEQELTGLKVGLDNIASQLSDLGNVVRNMASSAKTNWGTLAAWATVIIAAILYHNSIVMDPVNTMLERHEAQIQSFSEDVPETKAKLSALKENIELRSQLQTLREQLKEKKP